MHLHGRAAEYIGERSRRFQLCQRPNSGGGKYEGAHFIAIQSSDHHILHVRRTRGDDTRTQWPNTNEGTRCELEVFGNAPIELQALVNVLRVNPFNRVARSEIAFFVKAGGRLFRGSPIPVVMLGPL